MENCIVLIDGDEKIYQAAHASQHVSYDVVIPNELGEPEEVINFKYSKEAKAFVDWNPDKGYQIVKKVEPAEDWVARYNLETLLKGTLEGCKTRDYSIYLSGPNNFRTTLATLVPYKGDRPEEKPLHYQFLKDYLIEEHFAIVVDGMEADDALGIMSTQYTAEGKYTPVIDSQDKDLRMIPGYWYDKKDKEVKFISEVEGHRSFFRQLLTGDTTDCIPGIHGMGPATASKLIDSLDDPNMMYGVCLAEWERALKKGKVKFQTEKSVEEVILEIGRLLWIKRSRDQEWSPEIY